MQNFNLTDDADTTWKASITNLAGTILLVLFIISASIISGLASDVSGIKAFTEGIMGGFESTFLLFLFLIPLWIASLLTAAAIGALLRLFFQVDDAFEKTLCFLAKTIVITGYLLVILGTPYRAIEIIENHRLAPPQIHYDKCRTKKKKSVYIPGPNVCMDGWTSTSEGQGTCSHHGGIRSSGTSVEVLQYPFSHDQCVKKAQEISWINAPIVRKD